MNNQLFNAILAMDSYNRGYNAGIVFGTNENNSEAINNVTAIGNAVVYDSKNDTAARTAGFYAIAYEYTSGPNDGQKIISYRGTDALTGTKTIGRDWWNGYGVALGSSKGDQAKLAFQFYQAVAGTVDPQGATNISLTGHSLGGGLAGLVADVYHKSAEIFDNMPFENSAFNTYHASISALPATYDPVLTALVYGAYTPQPSNHDLIHATELDGQFLSAFTGLQSTPINSLDLGKNVDVYPDSVGLEPGQFGGGLHSMAALAIRMYAGTTAQEEAAFVFGTDWKNSAKYFWPVLFDDQFATDIGVQREIGGTNKPSDKLRNIIAYSAINEGTEIFGDVGIVALYHDADILGETLGAPVAGVYPSDTSDSLIANAKYISESFVQFAGQMAMKKVSVQDSEGEALDAAIRAADGVLSLSSNDDILNVNFSENLWKTGQSGLNIVEPAMVAKAHLFDNILDNSGGNETIIRNNMEDLWGDRYAAQIGQISFSTSDGNGSETISAADDADKATLYVGGGGTNSISVTSGNNIILAEGTDTVTISGGSNLIIGNGSTTVAGGTLDAIYITNGSPSVSKGSNVAVGVNSFSGSGTFNIKHLGNTFSGFGMTLDYSQYGSALTFNMGKTGSNLTGTVVGSATDTYSVTVPTFFGTNYGDTYNFSTAVPGFVYTGTGNDILNSYGGVGVYYSGGNDTSVSGDGHFILPFGLTTDVLDDGDVVYVSASTVDTVETIVYDLKITLGTGDSITFKEGLSVSHNLISDEYYAYSTTNRFGVQTTEGIKNYNVGASVDILTGDILSYTVNYMGVSSGESTFVNGTIKDETFSFISNPDYAGYWGRGGNDYIIAGSSSVFIVTGAGNDTIASGTGDNSIAYGGGKDEFIVQSGAGDNSILGYSAISEDIIRFTNGATRGSIGTSKSGSDLIVSAGSSTTTLTGFFNDTSDLYTINVAFGSNPKVVVRIDGNGDMLDESSTDEDYTMGTDEVSARLTGTVARTLNGSTAISTLIGNNAASSLVGNSTVGDDTFVVHHTGTTVTETNGGGDPVVMASVDWMLGTGFNKLTLLGTADLVGTGNTAANLIVGNYGNNTLNGGAGADTLIGNSLSGEDTFIVDNTGDVVSETVGGGLVQSTVNYTLGDTVNSLVLLGTTGLVGVGNTNDNILSDGDGASADTLIGNSVNGNDTFIVNNTGTSVTEVNGGGSATVISSVNWTLGANINTLILTGTGSITGTGNTDDNVLITSGIGADTLIGNSATGDDTFVVNNTGDSITETVGGGDALVISSVNWTLGAGFNRLTLTGTNSLVGTGNTDDNILTTSGVGADTLIGNSAGGNDTFVVNHTGDSITETVGGGDELVISTVDWTLGAGFDNLMLIGSGITGTANSAGNVIVDNGGFNTLVSGSGNDTLIDNTGSSTFVVNNTTDSVTENLGGGSAVVVSSVNWTLGANITNLVLTGTSNLVGTGNTDDNVLSDGDGVSADTLIGNSAGGNDVFIVNNVGASITETNGGGEALVMSTVDWTLGANLKNLILLDDAIVGTGNSLDNTLTAGGDDNTLAGGAGADTFIIAEGVEGAVISDYSLSDDDILAFASADITRGNDLEGSRDGDDLIFTLPDTNIITLTDFFVGFAGPRVDLTVQFSTGSPVTLGIDVSGNVVGYLVTGTSGNDTLSDHGPLVGGDTLVGDAGDDTYMINNTEDIVSEDASEGTDLVVSSVNWTLGANVENLTLTGSDNLVGTGNSLANIITGNSGIDTLVGGAGDDTYIVNGASDVVSEGSSAGTDLVQSSINWTLGANVENLTLTGTGNLVGTGNSLDNVITGNSGNDTLVGGVGNDTYIVNGASDLVSESLGAGTDLVQSNISWTLGANVENLTLTGTGNLVGAGNTLANVITGNSGDDTLIGGAGNDTYVVNGASDVVSESSSAGTDLVQSSVSWTLGADFENLTLQGNTLVGTGNSLDNALTAGGNDNTLTGGAGADTFVIAEGVDGTVISDYSLSDGDVLEFADPAIEDTSDLTGSRVGDDLIFTLPDTSTVTLTDFFVGFSGPSDDLTVQLSTGGPATLQIDSSGNILGGLIMGTSGDDTMNDHGTETDDTLAGAGGNDHYTISNPDTVIIENSDEGNDWIYTIMAGPVLYYLPGNVENLSLGGTDNIDGTGNSLANYLIGNAGINTLTGNGGNDTLEGRANEDYLVGGTGDDVYIFDEGFSPSVSDLDQVYELDGEGTDTILFAEGILPDEVTGWTDTSGNLYLQLADGSTVVINGSFSGDGVESYTEAVSFNDETVWDLTQGFVLNGTDSGDIVYGSIADDDIDSRGGNDTIYAYDGNDTITGGEGADNLSGGEGNDTYLFSAGFSSSISSYDQITENASEGTDTVHFTDGLLPEDIYSWTDGSSLWLRLADGSSVAIGGSMTADGFDIAVEEITFDDETIWDLTSGFILNDTNDAHVIYASAEADTIDGRGGNDVIYGYDGNDTITGGIGADTLSGGEGDDTYLFSAGFSSSISSYDQITENASEGTDTVHFTDGLLPEDIYSWTDGSSLWLQLADGSSVAIGGSMTADGLDIEVETITFDDETIWDLTSGFILNDTNDAHVIYASAEDDTLDGRGGDDVIYGYDGNDMITGGTGTDTLAGGEGNDTYLFSAGFSSSISFYDQLSEYASEGTDTVQFIDGLVPEDFYSWTDGGNLWLQLADGSALQIVGAMTGDGVDIGSYVEQIEFDDTTVWDLTSGLVLQDTNDGRVLYGSDGVDIILGRGGSDNLYGYDGNDTLDGGTGNDVLEGEDGNDLYNFNLGDGLDSISDVGGTDKIVFGAGITSSGITLALSGAYDLAVSYGSLGDSVTVYNFFAPTPDRIESIEFADSSIMSFLHGTTGAEALTAPSSSPVAIFAYDDADTLTGDAGNDWLDGGTGADTMAGGAGHDTYVVDDAGDSVTESSSNGTDTVRASIAYTLGSNVENLVLTDSSYIDGTGNSLDNTIIGNSGVNTLTGGNGNDWLDGGGGVDALIGGAGDDTYVIDTAGETITEGASAGTDTVQSAVTFTLGTNLENLVLTGTGNINGTGNTLGNTLTGNSGNNALNGSTGADTMIGGLGNDTYTVDNASDVVTENADEGTDAVSATVSWTLGSNIENLTFTGSSNLNGTGNSLNNTLTGNSGVNILDGGDGNDSLSGGTGADTMIGGIGNDTYTVDNAGDVITENSSEGTDSVSSSINYTLGSNVENLTFTGSSNLNGTGNTLDNTITGNSGVNILTGGDGNDSLNGGTGADTLIGGLGNDTYTIDNASDVITENASEGTDSVSSTVSYTLGSNVENLAFTGSSGLNGTGNTLDNVLTGNSGVNTLTGGAGNDTIDGGTGNDTLIGGTGDDIYYVNASGDVVTEASAEGDDHIYTTATLSSLAANVERLTILGTGNLNATGNSLANILTGNSGNNTLDGSTGADTLIGGLGNDTYVVDDAGDVATESASEGTDIVQASLSYTLANNVENLTLTGSGSINGTGNSLDNVLTGNSGVNTLTGGAGHDTLSGGTGADTLIGGTGNDTYIVDNTSDVVTENSAEGTDLIQSSVTYTISSNVENLTLTGGSNIHGTGNTLDNVITGNTGNNTLSGGDGADTLCGGNGTDILLGGAGNDILYGQDGLDTLTGGSGSDAFVFEAATAYNNIDVITDFTSGSGNDAINISNLLGAYTPGADILVDFVQAVSDGSGGSYLQVDRDGTGSTYSFQSVAQLQGITSINVNTWAANGNLTVS